MPSVLSDALSEAITAAPELQQSPSLAVGAANTADPAQAAQVVSHLSDVTQTQQAAQQVQQRHGWLSGVLGDVSKPLAWANKPLQMVQHEYRYVRDVYEKKGVGDGLLATLGLVAGGVVGGVAGGLAAGDPFHGAVLGAEGAGLLESRFLDRQVWDQANQGSIGRDVTSAVGLGHNRWTSGVVDGIFDLTADPMANALKGLGEAKALYFAPTAEGVERAADLSPQFNRAAAQIAGMDAVQVQQAYPKLLPIADRLAAASTKDAVINVFRDTARTDELSSMIGDGRLPSTSLTHSAFTSARQAVMDNADTSRVANAADRYLIRPFTLEPVYYDRLAQTFSNRSFNLADDSTANSVIYRLMRFGESDSVARDIANQYLAGNIGERERIFQTAVEDVLFARAGMSAEDFDPQALREVRSRISQLTSYGEGKYATNVDGNDISRTVMSPDGTEKAMGVLANQTGTTTIPNFTAVKQAAKELAGARNLFGKADSWAYDHYTNAIFKKLVLLNGGFAERISLSELIPNTLRNGFMNTVKSTWAKEVAKLGVQADDGELSHVQAAVYAALGGKSDLVQNSQAVQDATRMIVGLDGHVIPSAVDAAHGGVGVDTFSTRENRTIDLRKQIQTDGKIRERFGSDFQLFGGGDPHYTFHWQRAAGEAAKDPASNAAAARIGEMLDSGASLDDARQGGQQAAADFVRAHPETYGPQFARYQNPNVLDWGGDWGGAVSENVLGVAGYKTADGYGVNREILDAIANGETVDHGVLEAIPEAQQPINVKGRVLAPDTRGTLERIADVGHKKFLQPIINTLSREPVFAAEWSRQYHALLDAGLGEDEAGMIANQRATENVLKFIHNPQERSQLGYTVRNFMPFYFAQEQAYRRVGRLLADDPAAFRRYQLMMSGFGNMGAKTSDPNGNNYMVLPGTGFVTQATTTALQHLGIPLAGTVSSALSGNLTSMSTVFPFTGDAVPWHKVGPLVSISLHALEALRPETTPAVNAVIGPQATSGSLWDQLIPNQFVKNALQAAGARGETLGQHNSTVSIIQQLASQGKVPSPDASPMEQQAFVDRVRNQSRVLDVVKALFSLVSPEAPQVTIESHLAKDLQTYIKQYPSYGEAITHFLADHPDATAYTVTRSTTRLPGLPATREAQAWIDSHQDLVNKYPNAAAYLVPQSGKYDQNVYNLQLGEHLRQRRTDQDFLNAVYQAAGDSQFFDKDLAAHNAQMDKLRAAGDTSGMKQERSNFNQYVNTVLGPQNPVWWSTLGDPTRSQNKQRAIAQLIELASSGPVDSPMADGVIGLLADFATHETELQPSQFSKLSGQAKQDAEDNWQAYLKQVASDHPELRPVINALFRDPGMAAVAAQPAQAAA